VAAKPALTIVIASTRPGRAGLPIAEWFTGRARDHGGVEVADGENHMVKPGDHGVHIGSRTSTI